MTMNPITNYEDQLDSRDIQEWIDELQAEIAAKPASATPTTDYDELKALTDLKQQYVDSFGESSWDFGAQFIRYSYFKDFAQELAEGCGMLDDTYSWPNNCIDWEQAARELQMDYTSFDFDGVDYLAREA